MRQILSTNGSNDGPALHLPAYDATLSRGELERLVTKCARSLIASGIKRGDVVALAEVNSVEFVIGFLAITWASAVALPLNPNNKKDEFYLFLEDAKAKMVLISANGRPEAEAAAATLNIPIIALQVTEDISFSLTMTSSTPGFEIKSGNDDVSITLDPNPEDQVLILHTSGTTGRPKCVPHRHRNLCAALRNVAWTYDMSDEVSMHVMPLFHPHGLTQGLLTPLATGGSVILPTAGKFDPVTFWQDAAKYKATYYTAVPTIHLMLLARAAEDYPADNPPPLKFIRSCSAPLAPATLHKLETMFGVPVLEAYAMSECNQMCSSPLPRRGGRKAGTVGPAAGDIEVAIIAPDGKILPNGQRGEVCVKGPSVTDGYMENPAANAESFIDGWFHTGDEGVLDQDNYLTVTGRIKERINRGGEKISPNEIDSCLMAHPDVAEAVSFAAPDELYGQVVACAVRLTPEGAKKHKDDIAVAASIRKHVGEKLADFKVPAFVFVTDSIPKNATGKVQRRHVADHFLAKVSELRSLAAIAAAGQDTSAIVAAVWREVLGERFTDSDIPEDAADFFLSGGNSVRAMQAVSRLRESTGLDLPAAFVFMHRTFIQMVDAVNAARNNTVGTDGINQNVLKAMHDLPRYDGVPVSLSQEQLLLLYEQDPDRTDYLVVEADWIQGSLDTAVLKTAYEYLIQRHEALRTLFAAKGSTMVQKVIPADKVVPSWIEEDISSDPGSEEIALRILQEEMQAPFNLYKVPPCKAVLLRCEADLHLFFIKVHHICFDGWSRGVMVKELSQLYAGIKAGKKPEDVLTPAALPLQYADYSQWQRKQVDTPEAEAMLEYWKKHLDGAPPLLALPTDFPRPSAPTGRGGQVPASIPVNIVKEASKLAGTASTTIFTVLSCAFQLMLSRYARQEDVVIGTPSAGRDFGELENLIGFLVNPVPMRLIVDKEVAFADLLKKAAETVEGCRCNNKIPIQRIAQAIGAQRSAGYSPIYQCVFVLQDENFKRQLQLTGGLNVERVPEEAFLEVAMFDLTLELVEQADGSLAGSLKYSSDLFKPSTAERMVSHFVNLLTSAVTKPSQPVKELNILSEPEKQLLVNTFNNHNWDNISGPDEVAPPDEIACDAFVRFAESRPDAFCVMDGETGAKQTFKQVHHRSTGLAQQLVVNGAKPGKVIGVLMERSVELYSVMLGVHKSGAGYVALDPDYPKERLVFLLESAEIDTIITHRDCVDRTDLGGEIVDRKINLMKDMDWPALEAAGNQPNAMAALPRASPSDICYVTFTSGSTGKPKGAQVTHVSAVNYCQFSRILLNLKPDETFLLKTTTAFDASPAEYLIAMISGAMAVVLQPGGQKDIGMLIDTIAMVKPTRMATIFAPPSLAQAMLLDPRAKDLQHLQGMIMGGEAVEASLVEPLLEALPKSFPCNLYGPCETGAFVTANPGAGIAESGSCPIGYPIPNAKLYVLDADLQLVPLGVDGELCIAGKVVGKGYIGRPDLTTEKFIANPYATGEDDKIMYRTGDLARWLTDGQIEFRGRTDHQVKIRGLRIEMGEIEATLAAIPGVAQSAVVVKEDLAKAKQLVGYISPNTVDSNVILAALRETLPGYMVPTVMIQMDVLPTLPNGKINRLSLPEPEWTGGPSSGGYVPPATPLESRIQAIWQEALGFSPVSVTDDFFLIGGSSLTAMMVTAKMRAVTGLGIPGSHLFQFRTIQELAAALSSSTLERLDEEDMEEEMAKGEGGDDSSATGVPLPISLQQELYLRLHDVNPNSTAESLLFGIKLRGEVDMCALAVALNKTSQRHAAFRARYVKGKDGGPPMQIINPPEKAFFPLYHVDMKVATAAKVAAKREVEVRDADMSRRISMAATIGGQMSFAPQASGGGSGGYSFPVLKKIMSSLPSSKLSSKRSSGSLQGAGSSGDSSSGGKASGPRPPLISSLSSRRMSSFKRQPTEHKFAALKSSPFDVIDENAEENDPDAENVTATIANINLNSANSANTTNINKLESATSIVPERRSTILLRSLSTMASAKTAGYAMSFVPKPIPEEEEEGSQDFVPDEIWEEYSERCGVSIEVLKIMHEEAKRPFELWTDAPHCRALLITVDPDYHVLLINIHHGVSDGWTFGVFFNEFQKLYAAARAKEDLDAVDLPVTTMQNPEYCRRQRARLESGKMAKGLEFWKKTLTGVKEELNLPFDNPRPPISSYHGFTVQIKLDKEIIDKLKAAAIAQKTTLTVVLLACWRTMLHLTAGDNDFAIGWAMGGRTSEDLSTMTGCVSNLAGIRTNLKGLKKFSQVVDAEAQAVTIAQDHSTIPWLAVVRELGKDWGKGPHPVFGVRVSILDLKGLTQGGLQLAGLEAEEFSRKPFMHTSKYDLELEMSETPEGGYLGTIEYTTDRFERSTVQRIGKNLESLYAAVAANPDAKLGDLAKVAKSK